MGCRGLLAGDGSDRLAECGTPSQGCRRVSLKGVSMGHNETTRRDFLARTAGIAGAAAVLGSAGSSIGMGAWTPPRAVPRARLRKDDPVRIGIVGVGAPGMCAMGAGHIMRFAGLAKEGKTNCEIVAVCDLNSLTLEYGCDLAVKHGQATRPEGYLRHEDMFARDDIHGVVLAVPEHWHAPMAIDAIAAGKDVYVEKPMTLDLPDALKLREAVRANPDVVVQVGTQMINLPEYHEAKKLIEAGEIGVPTFSQCGYCRNSKHGEWHYATEPDQNLWPGAKWTPGENLDWERWCRPIGSMPWDPKLYTQWRRYRKTSTGIIGDLLVHQMTPILFALGNTAGWPVHVKATGAHHVDKEMENHDNIHITVQFESGHQMFVCGSTCNELGVERLIRGHRANIYLNNRQCKFVPERIYADATYPNTIQCPDIGNDQDQHRLVWLDSIRTRRQPISDVELGTKIMVIVDLAARSIWEGKAFEFNPQTMRARPV